MRRRSGRAFANLDDTERIHFDLDERSAFDRLLCQFGAAADVDVGRRCRQ